VAEGGGVSGRLDLGDVLARVVAVREAVELGDTGYGVDLLVDLEADLVRRRERAASGPADRRRTEESKSTARPGLLEGRSGPGRAQEVRKHEQ
jgi:hypothetical protein